MKCNLDNLMSMQQKMSFKTKVCWKLLFLTQGSFSFGQQKRWWMPSTALWGLLSQQKRSSTVTRHEVSRHDSKPCNAFGLSGVTSLSSSWRDSLEERLLAWARLWCGTARWLPLFNYTVCLWNLPRHTQHTMNNQNTWYDLLKTAKNFKIDVPA